MNLYISNLRSMSFIIVCFFLAPYKKTKEVIYSLANLLCFHVQVEMLKKQKDEVMIFHFWKILLLRVLIL